MKKVVIILLTFFLTTPFSLFAQIVEELEQGYYPFINYDENHIYFGQKNSLSYFFKNLDSLAQGEDKQVNIVQIGDSHIQADFFSNHIRKRTQKNFHFGNGGKGFIFPYRLAKTNNPNTYHVSYTGKWEGQRNSVSKHKYDWGVAGISATTYNSSATFSIKLNTKYQDTLLHYSTNNIRVYCPVTSPKIFSIFVQQGDSLLTGRIDTLGGYIEFNLDTLVEKVTFKLRKTEATQNKFSVEGIFLNNDENGIIYHSIGVNGAQFRSFLKCPKFVQHLSTLDPHLIILSLGTNDAYGTPFDTNNFRGMVNQLIKWIREASPNSSILFTCPGDNLRKKRYKNLDNERAGKVLFEIAKKENIAVWDLFQVMGGLSSIYKWQEQGLSGHDFLHMSSRGYILQGELLFQALIMDTYFGQHEQILKTNK